MTIVYDACEASGQLLHPSLQAGSSKSGSAHLGLKLMVNRTRHKLHCLWEEVIQQSHEDAGIISCQLAKIEISQGPQKHLQAFVRNASSIWGAALPKEGSTYG